MPSSHCWFCQSAGCHRNTPTPSKPLQLTSPSAVSTSSIFIAPLISYFTKIIKAVSAHTCRIVMERKWIHVVVRGDGVGIFSSWWEYARYVVEKSRAVYKKFETAQEARDFIARNLDEGEVELQHIHRMVELIRTLTPNFPYVPKKKEAADANKGADDFYHGFRRPSKHWEKGQSSSTPYAFKPVHNF